MKIIFLSFICSLTLFAFSQKELISIYENNFSKSELLKVKEINGYYFVVSSTINFGKKEDRKLALISKYLLVKFLKKSDKNISSIELKNFKSAIQWKDGSRIYNFSYVNKDNVIPLHKAIKEKNNFSINDEIVFLENITKKTIAIHEQLKRLYFQKGDMDNYNRQIDIIIKLKFNAM